MSKFKVGDYAGVGCMVNSCGECEACKRSHEQFCERGQTVLTYDCKDHFHNDEPTYGGYSNNIVVSEKFAINVLMIVHRLKRWLLYYMQALQLIRL